jgi:hypothetical protein
MEKGLEMEDCFFNKKLQKKNYMFLSYWDLLSMGSSGLSNIYSWARMIWDAATQVQV